MISSLEGQIVGVCGWKDSGKTLVVRRLVSFLCQKGYTVGTVKHVPGQITLEPQAKDSMKHLSAGASRTVTVGENLVAVMGLEGEDIQSLLCRHLWDFDFMVVEGFKQLDIPKVVVLSDKDGMPEGIENVVAVVYRTEQPEGIPGFTFEDIETLGQFLLKQGILKQKTRKTFLLVNGTPVPMNEFVQASLSGVIKGFIASLRNVEKPSTIELNIRLGS